MIHGMHRLLFFSLRRNQTEAPACYWKGGSEAQHGRISPPAVRWVLICCWHPQQSLLSYPTHPPPPPSSCQPFISQSLSVTHAPHYPCGPPPPQTQALQNCPWALLVPALLKRLVTQAIEWTKSLEASDRGPLAARVTNSRTFLARLLLFVAVVYVEGLRECPAEPRQRATVITCHSSQHFLPLPWPSPSKKKKS